jgi:hypothetical protein
MADTRKRKNQGLNGLNPLSYMGQNTVYAPDTNIYDRDPTIDDHGLAINDLWTNYITEKSFILVKREIGNNIWEQVTGGITNLKDQAGNIVSPDATGAITIDGGEMINTDAPFPSVIRVNLDRGLDGQIPIAATGLSTEWANITAGANVVVTDSPNGITISAAGGGAGDLTAVGNDGSTATSVAGTMNILGAGPIVTSGDMADTFTIETDGTLATSYTTDDAGSVVPAAGVLTITGNSDIVTSQSGPSTVRISRFQSSFLAFLNTEVNASGDSTEHLIGSIAAMTESFDLNGDFDPGDGAGTPATFSAPVKGIYLFTMSVSSSIPVGAITEHRCFMQKNLVNFFSNFQLPTRNRVTDFFGTNGFIVAGSATTVVDMEAGDVLTYRYVAGGGTKTATVESGSVSGVLLFQLP